MLCYMENNWECIECKRIQMLYMYNRIKTKDFPSSKLFNIIIFSTKLILISVGMLLVKKDHIWKYNLIINSKNAIINNN